MICTCSDCDWSQWVYLIGLCGSGRAWSQKATSVPPQSHPRWGQRQVSDLHSSPSSSCLLGPSRSVRDPLPASWALPAVGHPALAELMASSHLYELGPKSWAVFGPRSCFVPSQLWGGRGFTFSVSSACARGGEVSPLERARQGLCLPWFLFFHACCFFSYSGGSSLTLLKSLFAPLGLHE